MDLKQSKYLLTKHQSFHTENSNQTPAIKYSAFQSEILKELFRRGYTLDPGKYNFNQTDLISIKQVTDHVIGNHVFHSPMYTNFPQEVHNQHDYELIVNAIMHYWSYGNWMPNSEEVFRNYAFEQQELSIIKIIGDDDLNSIAEDVAYSNDSVGDDDLDFLAYMILAGKFKPDTDKIVMKEILVRLVALTNSIQLLSNTSDILRYIEYYSTGELISSKKFTVRSMPRALRRRVLEKLNTCIKEEDIATNKKIWKKVFSKLHVFEYKNYSNVQRIAYKLFNNPKELKSFNSNVESAIKDLNVIETFKLLSKRPTLFVRRMNEMYHKFPLNNKHIITLFENLVSQVPTKVLYQLLGHIKYETYGIERRTIFPKAKTQTVKVISRGSSDADCKMFWGDIAVIIDNEFKTRFVTDELKDKTVYIDPKTYGIPLPTQVRSLSSSKKVWPRGTSTSLNPDSPWLRFFVYWKGCDIDLTASFYDEMFNEEGSISYTNLKSGLVDGVHSGDITSAPKGASEFIDMNIDTALANGIRYVVTHVFSYSNITFDEIDECFFGYMNLTHPEFNNIYQPRKVENKFDIGSNSTKNVPVIIDLLERKVISADLNMEVGGSRGQVNIESNKSETQAILEGIINESKYSVSIGDMYLHYARANNCNIVSRTNAQVELGIPDSLNDINANWIK